MAEAVLDRATAMQEQAAQETDRLTEANRQRLHELRTTWLANGISEAEAAQKTLLLARLVSVGMVTELPMPAPAGETRRERQPIPVIGRPVSETLLEDREPHCL